MKVLLELDLEYEPKNEHYNHTLKAYSREDTPENYVNWGLYIEFWGDAVKFNVIEVQSLQGKMKNE